MSIAQRILPLRPSRACALGLLALVAAQSATAASQVTLNEIANAQVTVTGSLSGLNGSATCTACVTSPATGSTALDFSVQAQNGLILSSAAPIPNGNGWYSEAIGFGAGGNVNVASGATTLLSGGFQNVIAYAIPGTTTAALELDLNSGISSNVIGGLNPGGPEYLVIEGQTPGPVGLGSLGLLTTFTGLSVDWTADLQTTPFSPDTIVGSSSGGGSSGGGATVPEPDALALLGVGVAVLAYARRRSRN